MDQSTSPQPANKPHDAVPAPEGNQSQVPPAAKVEQTRQKKDADEDDEEDSDLDELDDVLDDFSKPSTTTTTTTTTDKQKQPENAPPSQPAAADESFDEQAFMKQLEQDMAAMMGDAQKESGTSDNKDFQDTVEQGADAFAKQLEDSGVPPGDFLKQLLTEVMAEEGGGGGSGSGSGNGSGGGGGGGGGKDTPSASAKTNANTAATAEETPESFNDAIHRTMNRMQESGDKATAAANDSDDVPDEMLLQLLKALESSSGGNDDDIQKMFMGFMEKMSSKDILYEPMKELEGKFEPWIAEKQAKKELSEEDVKRYQMQTRIVKEVVAKFEEDGYSDSDSKCREWVWERMQEMQNAGNPPDELIPNPLTDMKGAQEAALPPECAQQ